MVENRVRTVRGRDSDSVLSTWGGDLFLVGWDTWCTEDACTVVYSEMLSKWHSSDAGSASEPGDERARDSTRKELSRTPNANRERWDGEAKTKKSSAASRSSVCRSERTSPAGRR